MCFKFSKRSFKRMQGVDSDLIIVFNEAIKVSPIDFGIPRYGGLRTAEKQNEMFNDPDIETNCDGYENKSYHQTGLALDFYAYINGAASWEIVHLAMVAATLMSTAKRLKKEGKIKIDLCWGGTFGSTSFHGWDMPHTQAIKL